MSVPTFVHWVAWAKYMTSASGFPFIQIAFPNPDCNVKINKDASETAINWGSGCVMRFGALWK